MHFTTVLADGALVPPSDTLLPNLLGAPLIEDGSVTENSATLAHLSLGGAGRRFELRADVLNLLDSDDRDIQYFCASRLTGEQLEGVEDRHFHRFEPRQVRVTFTTNL